MALPFITLANQKVVLFKHFKPYYYGPFINTTPAGTYPILQELEIHNEKLSFKWPSSEQAYHAQKIIHLKKKLSATDPYQAVLTQALFKIQATVGPKQEFLPQHYTAIVEDLVNTNHPALGANKLAFDALCDAHFHAVHAPQQGINPATGQPFAVDFMRTVLRLKLEQHVKLKKICMQLAREGLLPIEVSRQDQNWASGPSGEGLNRLGTLILEEGNRLLIENGETPVLNNPILCYQELQRRAGTQLGHDVLGPQQEFMIKNNAIPAAYPVDPLLPQPNQGHYIFNNQNPKSATQAVYYDAKGIRSRGFYKPDRNIHAKWIEATSFNQFFTKHFPMRINNQAQAPTVQSQGPDADPSLPQFLRGHYKYNNQNPILATKAVYYDEQGKRSRGFYKPDRNIHVQWIEATSFRRFDINQFPEQTNYQFQVNLDQRPVVEQIEPLDADLNEQLIEQLRMDVINQEDLNYWSKQVFIGGQRYQGKLVPHSIAKALHYIQENKQRPYAEFKQGIEQILKEKSNSLSEQLGLSGLFRSRAVKNLREKAEKNHIEQFNPF